MLDSATLQKMGSREESVLDLNARHARIVGHPPRIQPLKSSELSADAVEANNNLRKAVSIPATDKLPDFTATMLRHPALYQSHMLLSLDLFRGALLPRDREIAILRVGWLCQSPHEWGEHVKIGKNVGGLTTEEVARIALGSGAAEWNTHDRALLQAVEELHADAMIAETTWTVLSQSLNEKQLIELLVLVGQYQGFAYLHNSLRIRLGEDNKGLFAR